MVLHTNTISKKADELLEYIRDFDYVNPLNMSLLTHKTSVTGTSALNEVYRLLKNYLLPSELIEPIPDRYRNDKFGYNRFYRLSPKGRQYFKVDTRHKGYKSSNPFLFNHDTQVIDFCTMLYLAYKDEYFITFSTDQLKKYHPDRIIVMTNRKTNEERRFFYEHETGERSIKDIWEQKLSKMNKLALPYKTDKFIMTLSCIAINPKWRYWEFTPEVKQNNYNSFILLKGLCRDKKLDERFIIRPFCDYPDIKSMKLIS